MEIIIFMIIVVINVKYRKQLKRKSKNKKIIFILLNY